MEVQCVRIPRRTQFAQHRAAVESGEVGQQVRIVERQPGRSGLRILAANERVAKERGRGEEFVGHREYSVYGFRFSVARLESSIGYIPPLADACSLRNDARSPFSRCSF